MPVQRGQKIGKRLRLGPFYIALRSAERRILKTALDDFKTPKHAAAALGITRQFFDTRALFLGGVYPDQPVREPPGKFAETRKDIKTDGLKTFGQHNTELRRLAKETKQAQQERKKKAKPNDGISDGNAPLQRTGDSADSSTDRREASSGTGGADPQVESRIE